MKDILFPHESIRPIQDKLVEDIALAVESKKSLIAHAPTGLGKTAAALAPAVTYAIMNGYTVFFLTPKHTQHRIAVETLKQIGEKHNMDIRVADLIGKRWMCVIDIAENLTSREFNEYCKDLRDEERCPFFNAVMNNEFKLNKSAEKYINELKAKPPMHSEEVVSYCKKEGICSYEIACQLAKDANVIIADYFHIFSPHVRAAFLNHLKKDLSKSIIIIDEAHNLPDRIRSILTNRLTNIIARRAEKEARAFGYIEEAITLGYIADALENLSKAKLGKEKEILIKKEDFVEEIKKSTGKDYEDLISELGEISSEVRKQAKRSFIGSIAEFLEAWQGEDVGFARILRKTKSKTGNDYLTLSYACLSPSASSKEVFSESISNILMSGTLIPGELYRAVLGLDQGKTIIKEYPSPFPTQNRLVLIEPSTTTKFTERSDEQFKKIAEECVRIIENVPHNSAVFFPSYQILRQVQMHFECLSTRELFVEAPEMSKEQKELILRQFKAVADRGKGAVLFGVMGASFGEGVDFPGKSLETVIIVGIPLGHPDLETKSLISFYDYKFKKGWDYGYIFPAMTRALQAAGRTIRSQSDRGAIIFMDERYSWKNYLKCIPPEWKPIVTKLPADKVKVFFSK